LSHNGYDYDYEFENERSGGVTAFLALQIHRENIKFEEESGIVKGSKLKKLPWCVPPVCMQACFFTSNLNSQGCIMGCFNLPAHA